MIKKRLAASQARELRDKVRVKPSRPSNGNVGKLKSASVRERRCRKAII